jgi:hypothetical protein
MKNKFWQELIRLLSLHSNLFQVLEHNLMEINLSEQGLCSRWQWDGGRVSSALKLERLARGVNSNRKS